MSGYYYVINPKFKTAKQLLQKTCELFVFQVFNYFVIADCHIIDDDTIKNYYLEHMKLGCTASMKIYARLYQRQRQHDNSEKYYLMAIDLGDVCAMYLLANYYYRKQEKDLEKAEKYYVMAFNHGFIKAAIKLGKIYEKKENHENVVKYYLIAIDHGDQKAFSNLMFYYNKTNIIQSLKLQIKYPKSVERKAIVNTINIIWTKKLLKSDQIEEFIEILLAFEFNKDDDIPIMIKTFINLLGQKIDSMKLHFDYSIQGKGFDDAKHDFINLISNPNKSLD